MIYGHWEQMFAYAGPPRGIINGEPAHWFFEEVFGEDAIELYIEVEYNGRLLYTRHIAPEAEVNDNDAFARVMEMLVLDIEDSEEREV